MGYDEALAAMNATVLAVYAEPTAYLPPEGRLEPVEVSAVWGDAAWQDAGSGVQVEAVSVYLAASDLQVHGETMRPDDRGRLLRHPGTEREEEWLILPGGIREEAGIWVVDVVRPARGNWA